jgi:hypothetical protein
MQLYVCVGGGTCKVEKNASLGAIDAIYSLQYIFSKKKRRKHVYHYELRKTIVIYFCTLSLHENNIYSSSVLRIKTQIYSSVSKPTKVKETDEYMRGMFVLQP